MWVVLGLFGRYGVMVYVFVVLIGVIFGWLYLNFWFGEWCSKWWCLVIKDLLIFLDFIIMVVEVGLNFIGGIE